MNDKILPEREYDWKCNCCRSHFLSEQENRTDDGTQNGGAKCPVCKADGQYTYRINTPAEPIAVDAREVESICDKFKLWLKAVNYIRNNAEPRDDEEIERIKSGFYAGYHAALQVTDLRGNPINPEPFSYGLIPYLWLKYVKKQHVHFIGRKGGKA